MPLRGMTQQLSMLPEHDYNFYSHAPAGHDYGAYIKWLDIYISTPMPLRGMTFHTLFHAHTYTFLLPCPCGA